MGEPSFRRDLYRGTAPYYDRFRVPYPQALLDELLARTAAAGRGRLLDLACGTGQISFALHHRFDEVWAVDQEPEMVAFARAKAEARGIVNLHLLTSAAEDLVAPEGSFALVAIGNAFHRLRRMAVTARALRWLQPGGALALLWADTPWRGAAPWQRAMSAVLARWTTAARAQERVPAGWEAARRERPDLVVLREAGLEPTGSMRVEVVHRWTLDTLVGCVYSTSFLSREVLGDQAARFELDLRQELQACQPDGVFAQTIDFACDVARRPG